jgi:hypothetical protein
VPYFKVYPGAYIPRALEFNLDDGETNAGELAKELLGLSKLNFNNTQFDTGDPITVRAARRVGAVALKGWSLVTIAGEFELAHAPVDPATAERVWQLTGGVPRFVSNAAALTGNFYSGDAQAFCRASNRQRIRPAPRRSLFCARASIGCPTMRGLRSSCCGSRVSRFRNLSV